MPLILIFVEVDFKLRLVIQQAEITTCMAGIRTFCRRYHCVSQLAVTV